MNLNNFTIKSQEIVQQAQIIAQELGHQQIENAHLLKGIFEIDENVVPFIMSKSGAILPVIKQNLDAILSGLPKVSGGELMLSREANQTLLDAVHLAKKMKDEYVAIEHLFLSIFHLGGKTSQMLKDAGLTENAIQSAITEMRKGSKVQSASAEESYNALNKYAKNLNEMARTGKLDPVIGRDEEIRRVLQILARRTKNNPLLIGDPGVGKTAIAEGLAHRIIRGDVPENLKNIQLFSLDISALIAGAKYKGEFEERLKSVVKEVTASEGEIVLFIDEIHTLVGAGGGEGAMDAANILKPALARGELRSIGATTLDEYQKHFEKDKALERRFQKVMIDEPDMESAISILRGIKDKYEAHHKVLIQDNAIIAAVELSQRYITSRFLPDKAIDLMDEAAAKIRMEINSKPEELDVLDRKVMQLEIEIEAIKREKDPKKVENLQRELADLKAERNIMHNRWISEKEVVEHMQNLKNEIENFKMQAEQAERDGNYEKVAELRYGKIKDAENKLAEVQVKISQNQRHSLIKEEVTSEDIAEVVAKWTGIPVQKMLQSEREKLLHLETELHKRVVGQEEGIQAVADAVRRSRAGLQDQKRPVGTFLFLGTTGVGKTELAKALAEYLFDDENALTRIDMSEYQERHAVSRLIGAPPGYVGYDEGGQLTEAVRRKPYSVVLLDEIEKAHPDTFNILLQVLDEGRLTDNKGRTANFRNTIIIMTSNMGSHLIQERFENLKMEERDVATEQAKDEVLELLQKTIRPEFLNRIDEVIMFTPLNQVEVIQIVNIQLSKLIQILRTQGITFEFTPDAVESLSLKGFNPQYGARPIKRVIQKEVLNALSKEILAGTIHANSSILLDAFDDQLVFRNKE